MVESTLIDVEMKKGGGCNVQGGGGQDIFEESVGLFAGAVEESGSLRIVGTSFDKAKREIFVVEDISSNGEYIEVMVSEVIEKVRNVAVAKEFVKVMMGERSPMILSGVTRIVGYFSRVNNWNRSKIGELRDRRKGVYGVSDL